nr:HAMP domain-containing sensor histidine kinase [Paenibacillus donghaensis]
MMGHLSWIYAAAAVVGPVIAVAAILLYRQKMKHAMQKLNVMLDNAIEGSFSESSFDESLLSAVEAKMARYLSSCAVSSKKLAEERDHIKSLISDISHQTKTPIASILLYSQLLGEHKLPEDCQVYVNALSSQAEKLDFLIGSLVKISRLETGIITVTPIQGDVQQLLHAAISQIKPKAEAKQMNIIIETTGGKAYFDFKWTVEALYNILDNAIKYSPANSSVKISATPYEMFLRIDISDEGIGIAEEEQSRIFLRFYRSAAAKDKDGVGIGLFLARTIISSGGGYIKVSSDPGRGSAFSVFLPTGK